MQNDLTTLSKEDLKNQLLVEQNPEKIKEILSIFNMQLQKQEAIRTDQLSDLQNKVIDQMGKRITERPDNFSNVDLLNFHKTIQDSITKSSDSLNGNAIPQIQFNQQINIDTTSQVSRESRKKVLDAVSQILGRAENNTEEYIEEQQEQEDIELQQEEQ